MCTLFEGWVKLEKRWRYVILKAARIKQRGLRINPFKDVIMTSGRPKSKVLSKSIIGDT